MHHEPHSFIRYFIALFIIVMGCTVAALSAAHYDTGMKEGEKVSLQPSEKITTISPNGHQKIKASVLDKNPASYKIDVRKLANLNVNQEAPTFAVYITSSAPAQCGDFRKLELPYKKPSKYERQFNLSQHKEVLDALDEYGCVVMRNIPPKN